MMKFISYLFIFIHFFSWGIDKSLAQSPLKLKLSQVKIMKDFKSLPASITVFGGSRPRDPEDAPIIPWAKSLCKEVSLKKEVIKTGGLGGFMSFAQEGYFEGAGKSSQALDLNRWYAPNPLIKNYFNTDRMTLRKWGLIYNTKAFLAFPGAMGTMDEFFETWKRKSQGKLKAPLILVGKEYWQELLDILHKIGTEENKLIKESDFSLIQILNPKEGLPSFSHLETPDKNLDKITQDDVKRYEQLLKNHDLALISNGPLGDLSHEELKKALPNPIMQTEFFIHHGKAHLFYPSDLESLSYFAALVDQIQLKLTYDRPIILINKNYWNPLLSFLKKIFKPGTFDKLIVLDELKKEDLDKILSKYEVPQKKSIQVLSSYYDIDFDEYTKDKKNLIIFDVDETLIQPEDNYFMNEYTKEAIDFKNKFVHSHPEIKSTEEWDKIFVAALKGAHRPLIEEEALRQIKNLSQKGIPLIAFTAMNNSQIVDLNTIEWRKKQLKDVGILPFLSKKWGSKLENFYKNSLNKKPSYKDGILISDQLPKGDVLEAFLDKVKFKPQKIVMFDDSNEFLKQVENLCIKRGIAFQGYEYLGAKRKPFNEELVNKQLELLIKTRVWTKDLDIQSL